MKQVLIVDDNILDNKAVRLALSGRYFTSSVTSGSDVFVYLSDHRPDMASYSGVPISVSE